MLKVNIHDMSLTYKNARKHSSTKQFHILKRLHKLLLNHFCILQILQNSWPFSPSNPTKSASFLTTAFPLCKPPEPVSCPCFTYRAYSNALEPSQWTQFETRPVPLWPLYYSHYIRTWPWLKPLVSYGFEARAFNQYKKSLIYDVSGLLDSRVHGKWSGLDQCKD